jgi:hypothetical protein
VEPVVAEPLVAEAPPVFEPEVVLPALPVAGSPFKIRKTPEDSPPVPMSVAPEAPALPKVPVGEDLSLPPLPPADPEEIWRQAAVELAAMKNAPVSPAAEEETPWAAMLAHTPPVAPLPSPAPESPLPSPPEVKAAGVAASGPAELPPWLKNIAGAEAEDELPSHDPAAHKAFLPTIRLAVPHGPQPLAPRRPGLEVPGVPVPPEKLVTSPLTSPVPLPGYRAEPLAPELPVPVAVPIPVRADPLDLNSVPVLPPFPVTPVPLNAPASVNAPAGEIPASVSVPPVPVTGEDKLYVPRTSSGRTPPRRKSLVTPARVGVLALIAAATLAVAFKPQLKAFWNQRILGRLPRKENATPPPATTPGKNSTGASDVNISPEPPAPAVDPANRSAVKTPQEKAPPPAPEPVKPASVTPPPAVPEPTGPLPVSEAGARELISRLLMAATPAAVKPYILDADRLAPGIETYFAERKATPVAPREIQLTGSEKSGAEGRIVWSFKVVTGNVPRGFPLAVEDTPEGLRTDWEFFTQCRDGGLRAFLKNPAAPSGLFYVSLMRAHPFADMLPEKDLPNFLPFTIASPILGDTRANVFLRKDTPLADRLEGLYKWDTEYAPVVTLVHKGGFVEITGIVRESWRSAAPVRLGSSR